MLDELLEDFDPKQKRLSEQPVISRYRNKNCNLRTQLQRILRRAGIEPWIKPFQNLRSTRETELVEQFPVHVVCYWLGNSVDVAKAHYLQVTDGHFQRALARVAHQPAHARCCQGVQSQLSVTRNPLKTCMAAPCHARG